MPLKVVSPPALWGWLLGLGACLHTASPSLLAAPSTAAVTATVAVAFALVAALALAGRARLDAAFSGDTRPALAAVRARVARTAFLPQRDPDASGRPRPRAPGH
ncbi:MAG TPA: DUF6412 domain-containing protein [Actinocrinis sp.]|nr:DUF6412 domain-containing protein [Actinocrinis sp.]